ncbi:hypothetical protein [Paraburkholderia elongata]|uniref:hypothetical protein n=1 Tax=Paraburkholderia elongata TaxID=2675747 RepID=UPI001F406523|nr:hypothetical protein [Paraburkholderia elongata]
MFEDRQVLVHMQQGDSDRDIALPADGPQEAHRCEARCPGVRLGWLDPAQPLPEDPVIAREFGRTPRLPSACVWTTDCQKRATASPTTSFRD